MVPPRKRKMVQTCPSTTTLSLGNCIIEFPSDADQELTSETLSLQVNQFASIKISVDRLKSQTPETLRPCNPGSALLPSEFSFQLINPKSLDKINHDFLESTTKLYKQELPAMSFAADTGKESDFLRNCTMNGKYCTLLMKKPAPSLADPEIVVGAITYQILPTSTQYAEIPLAAVGQTYQRQGLGSLLVKELARRLTGVGVLTLFCWGDRESERFWNKQGFLKIAEVDAQGKPQKLRLKNEIRKAMSLPGNSSLMVCDVPQVGKPTSSVSAGDVSPFRTRGTKSAVHTIEKSTTPAEVQQSPIAFSDVSDPYSLGNNPSEVPLCSDVSPAAVVTSASSPSPASAELKLKTSARGSSSKQSTNPTSASKPASAKSNRILRFSGVDSVITTEKETLGNATVSPPGQVVVALVCGNPAPVLKPCTERIIEGKVSPTSSIDTVTHNDIGSREPLRNVQNTCVNDVVPPVKKRPWRRTQCDNPNVAAAIQETKSTGSDFGPEKENQEPARSKVSEIDCEGNGVTLKSCLKRPRAETLPAKTIGRRSVRRRRCESPSPINLIFQSPELSLLEPSPILEKPGAAQKAVTSHDKAVLDPKAITSSRDTKVVDCRQSVAVESFSPSFVGEDHLSSRLEKHGKESTIRKRMSTRLVHVPDVGEDSHVASGYRKDSATATTPIVFLSSMPNDPKKRALAQYRQLVEKLGGKVTGDGGECTHVITSEVRRTVNFCTALCNGAWIVTPDWLKASGRHKSFVDEKPYILRDKQFESKYKVSLATVIQVAQRKPGALFTGFSVYPTPHVQPPLQTVAKLTQVAGGEILSSLDEALQQKDLSHTIVLLGEGDKEEGVIATKAGLRTFTGEWLMQAIVKQRVDFHSTIPSDH